MSLPTPITRKESYLAAIAGEEVQVPEKPITREEAYLDAIVKGGGGGEIIVDPVPTEGSTNAVSSGGTYTALEGKLDASEKGTASGVAELDANGKVLSSQLPSFVDDVVEGYYDSETDRFYEESTFETVIDPVGGKSWVDIPANKSYRWTGTVYVRVDEGVQLGETSNSAFRGDWGKTLKDTMGTGTLDTTAQTVIPAINELKENIPTLKTATGNPITLTDAANANAEELSMTIEPIQSGSGDPSPTNVRPISGISTATVQTTNGEDTNTATITFGQTVYGGSVNFKTGEVTVTHGIVDLGSLEWVSWSTYGFRTEDLNNVIKAIDNSTPINAISSEAIILSWAQYAANTDNTLKFALYKDANAMFIVGGRDMSYTDATAFKTAMSGVQLCYELATPTTLTLTPAELELLKGNNTITANGAEISIKYYPDNAIGALAERVDDKADTADVNVALAKKADITTVTIPRFNTSQAGWRRICKIKPVDLQSVEGMIYVGGFWSNGQQPSATVAVSIMNSTASLTLLSSAFLGTKRITAMRLVADTEIEFWLDAYFPAYSSLPGPFKFKFTGDIAVSDIQDPISITTDTTEASAEISLNQKVSGTVLTDKSSMIADLVSGKVDRFVSSSGGTSQTIDVGIVTTTNRMFLLSAGYSAQNGDYYVFGLIFIDYAGNIKYISLKDTQMTISVTYTDGIVSFTFSDPPYSNAVLIKLS